MKRTILFFLAVFCWASMTAQNGIIKGKVVNAINNEPIGFATVLIEGTDKGTTTDIDGYYQIENIVPELYNIKVSFIGFNDKTIFEIQVTNSKPAIVDVALEESIEQLDEVVVRASPFKKTAESPLSLRTIGVAEIQRNPGANRDISKVVQTLPGVTSTASFRNDLIIRGGAPNENRFYLDDVEIPNINHFATQGASGGPVGLLNVNFINEVDFYSAAFPANRGNAASSVFNFRQRDGRDDRLGATFMAGATDVGLTLEGPIGDKTTFLFSVRRSYLQFLFDVIGLPFSPTYNDIQAKVKYKIDNKNEITFIGLGALDQFELNLDNNDTEDKRFLLDNLPVTPQWNYTTGLVYKRYEDNGYWTFVLSRSMLNNEATKYFQNDESDPDNLILDYKSQEIENKLRIENTFRANDYKFNFGVGLELVAYNNRTFNRIFTNSGAQTIDYFSEFNTEKYYFFGQVSRKYLDERLSLSFGFRADGVSYSDEMNNPIDQFSPRFSLGYAISPSLSFNFNTGIYYQLPPYTILGYQEDGVFVNRENGIKFIRNTQVVAGLELNTADRSKLTLEAYYKNWDNYPFLLRDGVSLANLGGDFGVIGNEPAVPTSEGRSYGLEFLFQQRLYKGFYGIASYTLGWSEFQNAEGEFVPSSWDSRHIVNLAVGKKFGKDWEVGVNWRFQSALPISPFSDASSLVINWDVNGRGIRDFSQVNSLRNTASNTIDIRIDKKWFFKKWSLNLYLDIENLTGNAVNVDELILDRPLDANNVPIGDGIIVNPDAPLAQQRYALKTIADAQGTTIPSIGIMVEF
ncbi:MAG: TonB-dependent receptor [Bacteroidota bacterium]